jgi:hypothetical protein
MYWRDGLAKDAVNAQALVVTAADEHGAPAVAVLQARLDAAMGALQAKLADRAVQEELRTCKSKVNAVVQQTSQKNPGTCSNTGGHARVREEWGGEGAK